MTGAADDDGKDESTTVAHTSSGGGYGSVSANYTAKVTDDDRGVTVSAYERDGDGGIEHDKDVHGEIGSRASRVCDCGSGKSGRRCSNDKPIQADI